MPPAFRDYIGHANCRDIRESFQWLQKPVRAWHTGEGPIALGCRQLFALCIDGGSCDYAATSAERSRQSLITGLRSRIDKQQVDRNDFRIEACDCVDDPGKRGAGERIAALLSRRLIVDRNDGE